MELVVHIGQEKAGSSSIQQTLFGNSNQLMNAKALYVGLNFEHSPYKKYDWQKAGCWNEILQSNQAQTELEEVIIDTVQTASRKGYSKVIWSNESLFSSPSVVIPILKNVVNKKIKVNLIVYIRRHDSWARSAYLQWGIKHKTNNGVVPTFHSWVEKKGIHFYSSLEQWAEEESFTLTVKNFDAVEDLVKDFVNFLGLEVNQLQEYRVNDTPSNVPLNLWALYNSQQEGPVLPFELMGMFEKSGVINKQYHHVELSGLFPEQSALEQLKSDSRKDIANINRVFEENGEAPFSDKKLEPKNYNVSSEQLISCLLDIIKSQNDRIDTLEKKFDRFNKA